MSDTDPCRKNKDGAKRPNGIGKPSVTKTRYDTTMAEIFWSLADEKYFLSKSKPKNKSQPIVYLPTLWKGIWKKMEPWDAHENPHWRESLSPALSVINFSQAKRTLQFT